jgi:hypothetical protein
MFAHTCTVEAARNSLAGGCPDRELGVGAVTSELAWKLVARQPVELMSPDGTSGYSESTGCFGDFAFTRDSRSV